MMGMKKKNKETDFFTDQEKLKPLSPASLKEILKKEEAADQHGRKKRLLDALTTIAVIAIHVIPSVLAILYACVLIQKAVTGQWDLLETTLKSMLVPITTYLAGLLSKNVLEKQEK